VISSLSVHRDKIMLINTYKERRMSWDDIIRESLEAININ